MLSRPGEIGFVSNNLENPLKKRNENKALPNVLNTIKILYSFASVLLSKFQKIFVAINNKSAFSLFKNCGTLSYCVWMLHFVSVCIHKASKHMINTVNTNSINRT